LAPVKEAGPQGGRERLTAQGEPGEAPRLQGVDLVLGEILGEGETAYAIDAIVVDTPGITKELLTALYSLGGNVVKLYGYRLRGTGKGRILVIATYDRDVSSEDISRALGAVEGVLDYRLYGPYRGPDVVSPPFAGYLSSPTRAGASRILLLRASTLQYVVDTLYWTLPSSSRPLGLQVLYMLGRFVGGYMRSIAESVATSRGAEFLRVALSTLRVGGWVMDYSVSEEDGAVIFKFEGYWLRPLQAREGSYIDPFTAGLLEEILEGAYEGSWDVSLHDYKPGNSDDGIDSIHVYRAERL